MCELTPNKKDLIDGAEIVPKECFANCQRILMQLNQPVLECFTYVEGYNGMHPHAWIEHCDGEVWDPTRDEHWPDTAPEYRTDDDKGRFEGVELWECLEGIREDTKLLCGSAPLLKPFRLHECERDEDGDDIVVSYRD